MTIDILLSLFFLLIIYSSIVEPRWLDIERSKIRVPQKKIKTKMKIAFISDLHIGVLDKMTGMEQKVHVLCDLCRQEDVQMLILGGDIMDDSRNYLPRLEKYLSELMQMGIPVAAVTGNHDHQGDNLDLKEVERVLRKAGVVLLNNSSISLKGVQIIGTKDLLGDPKYLEVAQKYNNIGIRSVVEGLNWYKKIEKDSSAIIILVSHNADAVYLPGEPSPDVILAGHTHGGQMAFLDWMFDYVPFFLKKNLPYGTFGTKAGKIRRGNTRMLISRGIGSSTWPFRFLRRPQIHIIEIDNS